MERCDTHTHAVAQCCTGVVTASEFADLQVQFARRGRRYDVIATRQMMGLLTMVYVRSDLASAVRAPRTITAGTGLLGVLNNKGAIGISLQVCIHGVPACVLECQRRAYDP